MNKEKMNIVERSADDFKKLPQEKKMFVLGFMQGVLSNREESKGNYRDKQLQEK